MRRLSFEAQIVLVALAAALPSCAALMVILWTADFQAKVVYGLAALTLVCLIAGLVVLRRKLIFQLQTVSNVVSALREGDFSIRARGSTRGKGLAEIVRELNALGETLRQQRLGAVEATALLQKVMQEIDVAVFSFDAERRLGLINRAGQTLLGKPAEAALGREADELGLSDCLEGEAARTLQIRFPGGGGRWGLRRSSFREQGRPHQLVVLADLNRTLREEERQAWQRLIRVLGHELNNSLAPIKSIAGSLEGLLRRDLPTADWTQDMREGLQIISSRSDALGRFMGAYSRLARLPQPKRTQVSIEDWVRKVVGLETRMQVGVQEGPTLMLEADPDQLEQLLINLVQNAVDSSQETGGAVSVGWRSTGSHVEVHVDDEGNGLADTANLFVPFFTTKAKGTGIGLVLSRQIAEAHGGSLSLTNRQDQSGCRALLVLPLGGEASPKVEELK